MRPRAVVVSLAAGQLASSPQDTEAESEEVTTDTSPDESNTEDVTRADDTGYLTGEESTVGSIAKLPGELNMAASSRPASRLPPPRISKIYLLTTRISKISSIPYIFSYRQEM